MIPLLIGYLRTSTDDNQSPEDSRAWQVASAEQLASGRAEIIRFVHDIDVSRALPWSRRPQASALLAAMPDPARGWDGIIVGEPQRAFGSAAQVQLVLAQLAHWGVQLWVPELGGPVDPESEAHDILLSMFGGLSRAERNRLRSRVRTAMRAMASTGRFLGGRPPYGYRLVPTGTPHPNPEKARYGIMLTTLEIDPERAEVVRRIFQWRAEGAGYKAIAARLDDQGVPSPSASDPERNTHRHRANWGQSSVRAILENPRYKGTERYGAYRRVEELLDPTDPAAGHINKSRPSAPDRVLTFDDALPSIVNAELWDAAQPAPAAIGPRPAQKAQTPGRYQFRGLIECAACGRKMQGNAVRRKSGSQRIMYRCKFTEEYPGAHDHPKSLAVAEARITGAVGRWLDQLTAPDQIEATLDTILQGDNTEPTTPPDETDLAHKRAAKAQARLDRLYDLMEDPDYPVERARKKISEAKHDLATAQAALARLEPPKTPPPDRDHVRALIEHLGGLSGLLTEATPSERQAIYQAMGLQITYHRSNNGDEILDLEIQTPPEDRGAWTYGTCRRGDLNAAVSGDNPYHRVHIRAGQREFSPDLVSGKTPQNHPISSRSRTK